MTPHFKITILVVIVLIAVKDLILGSDFSFYYLFKYKREYWIWYNSRPEFKDYLKDKRKDKK
jgi:hypothetical protein